MTQGIAQSPTAIPMATLHVCDNAIRIPMYAIAPYKIHVSLSQSPGPRGASEASGAEPVTLNAVLNHSQHHWPHACIKSAIFIRIPRSERSERS